MKQKLFIAEVAIHGSADATNENLQAAIRYLLEKARKYTPDARFDWQSASVSASEK